MQAKEKTREDKRRQEKTREDKRRQEKTREDEGPGIPNNTGNAKKSDTSDDTKSKIFAPKTSFLCEIENEKDKQKENQELKQNLKNIFNLKLPNKTGNKDLFNVTNPKELNINEIKESNKEINEIKKSGNNIKTIEDESTKEHEINTYNIKVEKKEFHKKIKKVIIFIKIIIIIILNIQFNLIHNNNKNKSNEIKKKFKNYFIYFEPIIKSKEFIIIKEIISIPELKKDKKNLKINYNTKKYAIFVNDDNYLVLYKYDLNKIKFKNTKNSNINNNIILINKHIINILNNNSVNNSYLNKIQYFHYFSIHNNNKLNQINNFNIKNQNQNINYIKIRNKKLFLRILEENKAIITIKATKSEY